ncbi:MAG: maltotransferase domain-containing protein [Actinomycetota bacterium]
MKTDPEVKIGRIPILGLKPEVDGGRWAAKAYQGEIIPFGATVFREGHDSVGAELLLTSPSGKQIVYRLRDYQNGSDFFGIHIKMEEIGTYRFLIRAFGDDFDTWHHTATVKLAVGQDEDLMVLEGLRLLDQAVKEKNRSANSLKLIKQLILVFEDSKLSPKAKLAATDKPEIRSMFALEPVRSLVTLSAEREVLCERELAGCGSWYEFFPRSEGAKKDAKGNWSSGTFKTATKRLAAVASMGFDVLYLPPIHPIGEAFKKGPNNSLTASETDPGSPWAIGNSAGGHDAIHPDLGTEKDFAEFVNSANRLGLEIAMDFALQASPDHPWVREHPEWFTTRADGTIAYAENPPKKYQDIYPINFDNDPEGIYQESLRIIRKWIGLGVKIFRVDNPHTKPVNFWEWLIKEVNKTNPEVIFLAEAFTRPAIMHTLGKVGFQQSYTYFTWRNSRSELESYLTELAYQSDEFFRPNLWVTTPDILTQYLQYGGPPAHRIRAALAATAAPSWGVYAGYELYEAVARPGVDEHINSEKYEYKPRDWEKAEKEGKSLAPYLTKLNKIRKEHPALRQLRNLEIHFSDDPEIIVYSKHLDAHQTGSKPDTIIVVANLDPHAVRETTVHLELWKLGLEQESFKVKDLITGDEFTWSRDNYVKLDAFKEPVHILEVIR